MVDMARLGIKNNAGKTRMSLLEPIAMEGLARVLTHGAAKYDDYNWKKGLRYTDIIDAMERHLSEIKKCVDIDPEFGEQHIDHLGANWMFLSYMLKQRPDMDNRWRPAGGVVDDKPIS